MKAKSTANFNENIMRFSTYERNSIKFAERKRPMVCGFVNQVSRHTCRYEQQDKLKGKTVRPVSLRVLPRRIIEEKRLLAASCRFLPDINFLSNELIRCTHNDTITTRRCVTVRVVRTIFFEHDRSGWYEA